MTAFQISLPEVKTCSCGRQHSTIPADAKKLDSGDLAGWYWNCECRSTLYVPLIQVEFDYRLLNIQAAKAMGLIDDIEFIQLKSALRRPAVA